MAKTSCRHLLLILGDQLDHEHAALQRSAPDKDRVLMIECREESTHATSHKHRTVLFLSAMRHFAEHLRTQQWTVDYRTLADGCDSIADGLRETVRQLNPERVLIVRPGEWRLSQSIAGACDDAGVPLDILEDTHFLVTPDAFRDWADGRKTLTMEYFYREQRKRYGWLMDGDEPVGGEWNYDEDNRQSFGKDGPGELPAIPTFEPDAITREVIDAVNDTFADHPGNTDNFFWPVTRAQAITALDTFVEQRLPLYGRYQDAMWQSEPFLYHALISSSMNLKLISPREAIEAALFAWRNHRDEIPLSAIEGFVRQVVGWREFMRGVYYLEMPDYQTLNHFGHQRPLPAFFWDADTDLNCLRQAIGDTLANGYAHHIQRLMVIGNYATLAGLDPDAVCSWYLGIYVDAVEWVELPNTRGMALYADGGIVGSKPYVSSGAYINRMSNYCKQCRFSVSKRTGDNACPFNALYWDFLHRHRDAMSGAPRMNMVLKNLDRWDDDEIAAIKKRAAAHRDALS